MSSMNTMPPSGSTKSIGAKRSSANPFNGMRSGRKSLGSKRGGPGITGLGRGRK